jgi:tRNA-dihydrouridine synthase B
MRIGSLELESSLCLSPLAGYTNLPFRLTLRELGGLGLATTDLVNARSLLERRPKALELVQTAAGDEPLAVQLFGSVPDEMREAARVVESLGVAAVDINMGCPVRKVCRVGGGSAMMTELVRTARLVEEMVRAVRIPVTVKMRLGWDDDNLTAPELARVLEGVGVAAVFVHGRTREQGFGGAVNLGGIRRVVEAVQRIPVIGNGDITTPLAAKRMMEETGCAGVSIGRGAFYNPWIFRHTTEYLKTGRGLAEPGFEERVGVMRRHLERMVEVFGEVQACRMFRKVGPWYARRFGPAKFFNQRVATLGSLGEFEALVADYRLWRSRFLDAEGQLLPQYEPVPPGDVGLPQGAGGAADRIAVPGGPVERW